MAWAEENKKRDRWNWGRGGGCGQETPGQNISVAMKKNSGQRIGKVVAREEGIKGLGWKNKGEIRPQCVCTVIHQTGGDDHLRIF